MIRGPRAVPAGRSSGPPSSISVAGVTLDTSRRCVAGDSVGSDVTLTPLQTAVLAYLMRHQGEVCTRPDLMREALGYLNPVGSRTIDVHIATLRSKLGGALEIRAVRGVGYVMERPPHADRSSRAGDRQC